MSRGAEENYVNLIFGKRPESERFQILNALIVVVVDDDANSRNM